MHQCNLELFHICLRVNSRKFIARLLSENGQIGTLKIPISLLKKNKDDKIFNLSWTQQYLSTNIKKFCQNCYWKSQKLSEEKNQPKK